MQRRRRLPHPCLPTSTRRTFALPQARLAAVGDLLASGGGSRAATAAALNVLQEGLQEIGNAPPAMASPKELRSSGDVALHANTPPPFRGAHPSAQPVALPSLPADAPPATIAHKLLGDTEAAIARQTLLQVASLPDRIDTFGATDRSGGAALAFRNPVCDTAGHRDGGVRDFARRRR